jgi:hypothetical protein
MDRLTIKGFGAADGTYEFDLFGLVVDVNGPEALTVREQQRIKALSGYRGLEIRPAVGVMDPDAMVALADTILERHGQSVSTVRLFDAKWLYTSEEEEADMSAARVVVNFHMGGIEPADGDEDEAEAGKEVEADNPPV